MWLSTAFDELHASTPTAPLLLTITCIYLSILSIIYLVKTSSFVSQTTSDHNKKLNNNKTPSPFLWSDIAYLAARNRRLPDPVDLHRKHGNVVKWRMWGVPVTLVAGMLSMWLEKRLLANCFAAATQWASGSC